MGCALLAGAAPATSFARTVVELGELAGGGSRRRKTQRRTLRTGNRGIETLEGDTPAKTTNPNTYPVPGRAFAFRSLPGHGFRFPSQERTAVVEMQRFFDFNIMFLPHAKISSCRVFRREGSHTDTTPSEHQQKSWTVLSVGVPSPRTADPVFGFQLFPRFASPSLGIATAHLREHRGHRQHTQQPQQRYQRTDEPPDLCAARGRYRSRARGSSTVPLPRCVCRPSAASMALRPGDAVQPNGAPPGDEGADVSAAREAGRGQDLASPGQRQSPSPAGGLASRSQSPTPSPDGAWADYVGRRSSSGARGSAQGAFAAWGGGQGWRSAHAARRDGGMREWAEVADARRQAQPPLPDAFWDRRHLDRLEGRVRWPTNSPEHVAERVYVNVGKCFPHLDTIRNLLESGHFFVPEDLYLAVQELDEQMEHAHERAADLVEMVTERRNVNRTPRHSNRRRQQSGPGR